MSEIRDSFNKIAEIIEKIDTKKPRPMAIADRSLSGNKIDGGTITNFSSTGISDIADRTILTVSNDGIRVDVAYIDTVQSDLKVNGNLKVNGTIHATKLKVDEVTTDAKLERTSPLSFVSEDKSTAYGKGLLWPGGEATKQLILLDRPDRLFSTEALELRAGKIFMINGQNVLSQDELGISVVKSNLKKLGTLDTLNVDGPINIDNYIFYDADSQRLGVGTEAPNGMISVKSWDHEFIIDDTEDKKFKIGTYTTSDLEIITDDSTRISIGATGNIVVSESMSVKGKLGVGVKNFTPDADLTVGGPMRMQGKKFETGDAIPDNGNYVKGDIVWNSNPKSTDYVGWICIRSGTPGTWKPFGQIAP